MKKILISFLGFSGIVVLIYVFLLSDLNPIFENEEFKNLKQNLEMAKNEDVASLDELYNKIHHNNKERNCPCNVITKSVDPFRHQISPKTKVYALKIKQDFGHDACLKLELLKSDYLNGNIGVKSASQYYFHKLIQDLNEKKNTLLVML